MGPGAGDSIDPVGGTVSGTVQPRSHPGNLHPISQDGPGCNTGIGTGRRFRWRGNESHVRGGWTYPMGWVPRN